jgi:hypothetical protein
MEENGSCSAINLHTEIRIASSSAPQAGIGEETRVHTTVHKIPFERVYTSCA